MKASPSSIQSPALPAQRVAKRLVELHLTLVANKVSGQLLRHPQQAALTLCQFLRPALQGALLGPDGLLPGREDALALLERGGRNGGRSGHKRRTTKGKTAKERSGPTEGKRKGIYQYKLPGKWVKFLLYQA
jgi:hypothetical protein